MITLVRTDSGNSDFIALVKQLDLYLADKDGDDHAFYARYNKIDQIKHAVVAYENNCPVACGAIKHYEPARMEVKRMYTSTAGRNKGFASMILAELESWSAEMNYTSCVLETGKRQLEAIALYKKNGYEIIPNYGQYEGIEYSICFEKTVAQG